MPLVLSPQQLINKQDKPYKHFQSQSQGQVQGHTKPSVYRHAKFECNGLNSLVMPSSNVMA